MHYVIDDAFDFDGNCKLNVVLLNICYKINSLSYNLLQQIYTKNIYLPFKLQRLSLIFSLNEKANQTIEKWRKIKIVWLLCFPNFLVLMCGHQRYDVIYLSLMTWRKMNFNLAQVCGKLEGPLLMVGSMKSARLQWAPHKPKKVVWQKLW